MRLVPLAIALTTSTALGDDGWFTDVAASAGIDFVHRTGATGDYSMPEITAAGCALFDADGDGDLDAYLLQGYALAGEPDDAAANRLYRNDTEPGGAIRFVDVTPGSGAGDTGYAQGCAVGDFDDDGHLDLFVANFGSDTLYRNRGDGTFEDASSRLPADERWSTSASFLDYDRDGDLDLYVTTYVAYSVRENRICHGSGGQRDYCGPEVFDPTPDRLLRNDGDRFTDVSEEAGLHAAYGSGLGVVCVDVDRDGHVDIYVANDGRANQLWMNDGRGAFRNEALFAGAAYNADGMAEAGMGVDAADFDRDGDDDLFLTHLLGETNTLLVNDGTGLFDDGTTRVGLAAPSRVHTGFGTRWADFDHDGYLDLFVANGAVKIEAAQAGEAYPYANPNVVLRNLGPPAYRYEVVENPGAIVQKEETSRGAAFGDVDGDGDIDILVTTSQGPARLLRNDASNGHWLRLRLVGTHSTTCATGARVDILVDGEVVQSGRVYSDGSYASASDLHVHFGVGDDDRDQQIRVTWPRGRVERFRGLGVDRTHVVREGTGVTE